MHNLFIPEPHTSPHYPYLILHYLTRTKQYDSLPHHYQTTLYLHNALNSEPLYYSAFLDPYNNISIQYHSYPSLYTTSQYPCASLPYFTTTITHMIHLIYNQYPPYVTTPLRYSTSPYPRITFRHNAITFTLLYIHMLIPSCSVMAHYPYYT